MTMVEKQALFLRTIAEFIENAYSIGYLLTAGEFWRPPELAKLYAEDGRGINNSLHIVRLAADINAFWKGEYLDGSKDDHLAHLQKLGQLWKSLDPNCAWGGDFAKKDYNHYSFQHNGVK